MKIKVVYWVSTTQKQAIARTYQSAMRIARRNSNSCSPTFWSETGEQLVDLGGYFVEVSEAEKAAKEKRPIVAYA